MWINKLKYEYEKKLADDAIGDLEQEVARLGIKIKSLMVIKSMPKVDIGQLRQEAFSQQARSQRLTDMQSMQKHFSGLCGLGSGIESQRSNALIGGLGL